MRLKAAYVTQIHRQLLGWQGQAQRACDKPHVTTSRVRVKAGHAQV